MTLDNKVIYREERRKAVELEVRAVAEEYRQSKPRARPPVVSRCMLAWRALHDLDDADLRQARANLGVDYEVLEDLNAARKSPL